MGIMEQAKRDALAITTDAASGFALPVTFTDLDGLTVTVNARATKHHLNFDPITGIRVNAKNASVTVAEAALAAVSYPTRNSNHEAAMLNHRIAWTDSTGQLCNYVVAQCYPDESIGLLVCILADFE